MRRQFHGASAPSEPTRTTTENGVPSSPAVPFARETSPTGLYDAQGRPLRLVEEFKTPTGTVRRLAPYAVGLGRRRYYEYISDANWAGVPLVHIAAGRNPETGKWAKARGIVAIGQFAVGVVSIGQLSVGVISIGQLSLGGLAAIGQLAVGTWAVGQLAVGIQGAVGMIAAAFHAIGMLRFAGG